jgi:hypothetical protein
MTESEMRLAVGEWALRRNPLFSEQKTPSRARMINSMVERTRGFNTFDIDQSTYTITRICPSLIEDFPFFFKVIGVGSSIRDFSIFFDLHSLDKYRKRFKKMLSDGSADAVVLCHMQYEDVTWVLKMWRHDSSTIRTMYVRDLRDSSVSRLLLEGLY